jgi:hypothetical protein
LAARHPVAQRVLADQDLFQADTIIGNIRLNDFFDAFEMGGKPLARPWCSFRLVAGGTIKLTLDRREAGHRASGHSFYQSAVINKLLRRCARRP